MNKIWTLAKKELDIYFLSPIAYIVFFVMALVAGYYFYIFVYQIKDAAVIMPYLFSLLSSIILFVSPFYTMRLISEEKKTGTIDLLLSAPVLEIEVALGKFLGSFLFFIIITSPTFLYVLILMLWGHPDLGVILSNYIGLYLMGGAFISLGLVASASTKNQIVAAVLTFLFLLFVWLIGWMSAYFTGWIQSVLGYLSFSNHFSNFNRGVIDSTDLIFFLSIMAFDIVLSSHILSYRK